MAAVHLLMAASLGWTSLGLAPEDVRTSRRYFVRASQDCETPFLAADLHADEPAVGCGVRPGPSSTMWAWASEDGENARAGSLLWLDVLDRLPATLDVESSIEGVLELQSSHRSGYLGGGNADIYLWIEAVDDGGRRHRWGGIAHDGTTASPDLLTARIVPLSLDVPDALRAVQMNQLVIGIELAGVRTGHNTVVSGGRSWIDLPIEVDPSTSSPNSDASCPEDPLLERGSSTLDVQIVDAVSDPILDFDVYRYVVPYDFRRHPGDFDLVQIDVTMTWDGMTDHDTTMADINLIVEDVGGSILIQPVERGPEYLAGVVQPCGVLELYVTRTWPTAPITSRVQIDFELGQDDWLPALRGEPLG